MTVLERRGLVLSGLVLSLGAAVSGCGFRPVYMPREPGANGSQAQLGMVRIAQMGERSGQLLRQELQARMDRGEGIAKKYELVVNFVLSSEVIGIQADTSATRIRYIGTANWSLKTIGIDQKVVTTGTTRILDGLNILDQQYFEADLVSETVIRRVAANLADNVTLQLAAYFARQPVTG